MKKRAKKLVLAKDTVRKLTDDLLRVRGGESNPFATCSLSNCPYMCDMPETTYPTCIE